MPERTGGEINNNTTHDLLPFLKEGGTLFSYSVVMKGAVSVLYGTALNLNDAAWKL